MNAKPEAETRKKPNTETFVYQRLKTAIFKKYIKGGARIREEAVAEQLGVSRTPVRAAIKRLSYEGFLETAANRGALVVRPTLTEIRQSFAVRLILEKACARKAARNITPAALLRLKDLVKTEARLFEEKDLDRYYAINNEIHLSVARAAGNDVLLHYARELVNKTTIYLVLFDPFYDRKINPSMGEHSRIVAALEEGSPKAAGAAMEAHLQSALDGMRVEPVAPEDYLEV